MKYIHVKGLELQNRNMLKAPNFKLRALLAGEAVDLTKEEAEDILVTCSIKPAFEKKENKKKTNKKLILEEE
tara:strand:- start:512 stop:727 length:216 start_codon:yes stop_codon:yes gene_type:complete